MARREFGIKKRGTSRRKLKPVYLIIAEGKNKTEVLYLSHFQDQEKRYSIRFVKAGYKTDADSLYNALIDKWEELDLSEKKGDRGFVVLDIDNDSLKAKKYQISQRVIRIQRSSLLCLIQHLKFGFCCILSIQQKYLKMAMLL